MSGYRPNQGYCRIYDGVLEMLADGATHDDVRRCMAIGRERGEESYRRENPDASINGCPWSEEFVDSVAVRAMEDALAGRPPSPQPGDP